MEHIHLYIGTLGSRGHRDGLCVEHPSVTETHPVMRWDAPPEFGRQFTTVLRLFQMPMEMPPEKITQEGKLLFEKKIGSGNTCWRLDLNEVLSKFEDMSLFAWAVELIPDKGKPVRSDAFVFHYSGHIDDIEAMKSLFGQLKFDEEAKQPKYEKSSSCFNGDLEEGNFSGWRFFYGNRKHKNTIHLNNATPGQIAGRHKLMTAPGNDPWVGPALPYVNEGSHSLRLGNDSDGGDYEMASFTFVVDPSHPHMNFRYATVLQDPGVSHTDNQKPRFMYYVSEGTSHLPVPPDWFIAPKSVTADRTNPFFTDIGGGKVYRGWTPTCIDLSAYAGQVMTLNFLTTDCAKGGHWGYAYIDGLCVSNAPTPKFEIEPVVCADQPLMADGSASTLETSHFWSVQESDSDWNRVPGTEIMDWFVAQEAGPIDLTAFVEARGGQIKCNTHYRVKLAVGNDCVPWKSTTQLIRTKCPKVDAGGDICVPCSADGHSTQIGDQLSSDPSLIYNWEPATGLSDPNSPHPFHEHGSTPYPMTYTLTVVDADKCSYSDTVTLYCQKPWLNLEVDVRRCDAVITANSDALNTVTWSNGDTSPSIVVTQGGDYTATVTNPCGTSTQTINVPNLVRKTGDFGVISYNRFVYPAGGGTAGTNDQLYIKDVDFVGQGGNPGTSGGIGAYNANEYRLRIFHRWGALFLEVHGDKSEGFANWEVAWDGRDASGNLVQQDVYVWTLEFKNCSAGWGRPKERIIQETCVKWRKILWWKVCTKKEVNIVDVPFFSGHVNIIR